MNKVIPFSPPDITQAEIDEVVDTLKSGWITTGPKTKRLEKNIADYCGVEKAVCLNSATAGLELSLRLLDIGEGDEVITTPYTYAATANVILHVGARPVFVDVKKGEFNIDPDEIGKHITSKTKAIMPVDFAGFPCDYDEIKLVLEKNKGKYSPKKDTLQEEFSRPVILADSAHSFGATYNNKKLGSVADFTVFSFHAVKNLTTAEGGAITFNTMGKVSSDDIYKRLMLLSLHGQSKDALAKTTGSWEYTIELPGYKFNMTDIQASLGLVQLKRYPGEILPKRKKIHELYSSELSKYDFFIVPNFCTKTKEGSYHLLPLRVKNINKEQRSQIIKEMAERKIALNVHFIPVVTHPAYKKLGYDIKNYPNTIEMFENEISLPIYSSLAVEDVVYICRNLVEVTGTVVNKR